MDFVKTASSLGAPSAGVRTPRRTLLRLLNRAAPGEKETLKRRMAEIDEAGAGDEESTPPSLTPVYIRSSKHVTFGVIYMRLLIYARSIATGHRHEKINNFATFKNGTGAPQRANRNKPRRALVADSVSRKMVRGWGRPTTGSGRTRARKGRGPIAYPTGKLFEARTGCLNEAMTHFRYLLFLREAVAKSANTKKPQRSLAQHDK